MKEKTCRYGHVCSSGCQKDYDCPCQDDHCCAMTENCDGDCDDCFRKEIPGFEGTYTALGKLTIIKNK